MNGTKTQDELIRDLPPEISNLLFNTDLDFYLMNLLGNYGIADDQKMLVVLATRALLVGDIAPTEFVKLVSTVTGLDQSKSSLIAQDINRDVFNPVKDALKLVHSPQAVSTTLGVPIPTPYRAAAPLPQTPPRPTIAMPMPPLPQPTPSISNPPRAAIVVQEAPVVNPVLPKPMQMPPPPVVNNLEAKLGGAFAIKKEVMYTQPGTPAPLTPMSNVEATPLAMPTPPMPRAEAPVIPVPEPSKDPYRELPS